MAEGAAPRRGRASLSARSAVSGPGERPVQPRQDPSTDPAPPRPGSVSPPSPGARHCWVVDAPRWPGRWPGLLAEWRQTPVGWEGRVAFVPGNSASSPLVETWLPAIYLTGAG
jgi:hypothetical protein